MSNIFLFRGKAATGKTTITNLLSKKLNVPILRKDDIFDKLAIYDLGHSVISSASYDILAKIIQTNIDTNCNLIVDISLGHNPYLSQFMSKNDFKQSQINYSLCICSNHEEWKKRIEKRLNSPLPNQFFKSVKEAEEHYNRLNIEPLENEVVLDSSEDVSIIMEKVYKSLNFTVVN